MLFGNFAESQSKDLGDPIDNEEFAEAYGYFSDSDLEDGEDEKPSLSEKATKSEVHLFDPFETPDDEKTGCEVQVERIEKGKVVKIPDIAFVTWVIPSNLFSSSLMPRQIPSIFDVSLHGCDEVCTIRVGR